MDEIERVYRQQVGAWTGQQRVARSVALFDEVRDMLYRKIQREHPELDDRSIRLRVARSLYRTDPVTQSLLDQLER